MNASVLIVLLVLLAIASFFAFVVTFVIFVDGGSGVDVSALSSVVTTVVPISELSVSVVVVGVVDISGDSDVDEIELSLDNNGALLTINGSAEDVESANVGSLIGASDVLMSTTTTKKKNTNLIEWTMSLTKINRNEIDSAQKLNISFHI